MTRVCRGGSLNVFYLTRTGLLDVPILYLSHHPTYGFYDRLLQAVHDDDDAWDDWMLDAVAYTAIITAESVEGLERQMRDAKHRLR